MADRSLNKYTNDSPWGGARQQMDMCRSSIDFPPQMNLSRWSSCTALYVQAVNGTNELKYVAYGGNLFLLMFLFYAFSDAGIDAKPKFICKTFNFVEGLA